MSEPKRIASRSTFRATIESPRLHALVMVHTLWLDGSSNERVMPLFDALEFQARHVLDAQAITVWRKGE